MAVRDLDVSLVLATLNTLYTEAGCANACIKDCDCKSFHVAGTGTLMRTDHDFGISGYEHGPIIYAIGR